MTEAGGGDGASRHVGPIAYMARNGVAANLLMVGILAAGLLSLGTIEVPAARLRAQGLTLSDMAAAVRSGTLELSAGSIEPRDERVRIRTAGRSYNQHDFENIIVLARNDGTTVRLADIAEVRDGLLRRRRTGQPLQRPRFRIRRGTEPGHPLPPPRSASRTRRASNRGRGLPNDLQREPAGMK